MGEVADDMLNGVVCENCGTWLGYDVGCPMYCSIKCAKDRGAGRGQVVDDNYEIND